MAIFHDRELEKLRNPGELLSTALETHELALRLSAAGRLPQKFFERDIYEYGETKTSPLGGTYQEISHYWGESGASLFILGEQMLYLSRDETVTPLSAHDGDLDLYLTPLLHGLPPIWDFVVDMLQTEERFRENPPASVFWFTDGFWHVTEDYELIEKSEPGDRLFDYRDSVSLLASEALGFLFLEPPVTQSRLMENYFKDWIVSS